MTPEEFPSQGMVLQYDEHDWRAMFHTTGTEHSATSPQDELEDNTVACGAVGAREALKSATG